MRYETLELVISGAEIEIEAFSGVADYLLEKIVDNPDACVVSAYHNALLTLTYDLRSYIDDEVRDEILLDISKRFPTLELIVYCYSDLIEDSVRYCYYNGSIFESFPKITWSNWDII